MAPKLRIVAAVLAAAIAVPAMPGVTGQIQRVVVESEVHGGGRTPAAARREALDRARELAVARVAGIQVSAQQLRLKSEGQGVLDAFASLVRTSTSGRIVREEVEHRTTLVDGLPVYHARIDADVLVEQRAADPGFVLELVTRPDTHTYRDGEALVLEFVATKDCHLTLLNVLSDGTVRLVFPADAGVDNRVVAGRPNRFPDLQHARELRVHLADGRERDYEQLIAIATLDPVPFELDFASSATVEATLEALNRWLVSIPVDRRTEALWDYEIVR